MKLKILLFLIAVLNFRCGTGQISTEKEYLNNVVATEDVYRRDKENLTKILHGFLINHEGSFYSSEYYDSTEIIIDTVMYNTDYSKVAIFVVSKNPVGRQLNPNKPYEFYYDGFCYIGEWNSREAKWDLKWFDVFNEINFYDYAELTNRLRHKYFLELRQLIDVDNAPLYKYNLNDKRFWSGPVWEKYF